MQPNRGGQSRIVTAVRSEINVTPLVDVCLVLLIIFMVVAPLLRRGIEVVLPETVNPRSMPEVSRQITLSMTSDGSIFVDHARIPMERLAAILRSIHDQAAARLVVVDGDRRLRYEKVATVLQMVRDAGFDRAGLATLKRKAQ
jgi:biopolymer transport protein TolR